MDLPGFDQDSGIVRLTDDPERMRDSEGRQLMYPGRSHPLTQRAIASVRTGRVSAARADSVVADHLFGGSRIRFSHGVFALLASSGWFGERTSRLSFMRE